MNSKSGISNMFVGDVSFGEHCCGDCCHFMFEESDGWGVCPYLDWPVGSPMHCSDLCTAGKYVPEGVKRHYLAVLLQANRYRRDQHVPSIYRMPDQKEFVDAIDFIVDYAKIR